jgi:hypothetical protein
MKAHIATVLTFLCFFAVVLTTIITAGLSVGFVLNWLVPSIDLGIATLCGLVSVAMFGVFVKSFITFFVSQQIQKSQADDSDDDEVLLSKDHFENLADQLSEVVMLRMVAREQWITPGESKSRENKSRSRSRR